MNKWTRKSIELFNESDYLDKLSQIYPNYVNDDFSLSMEKRKEIIEVLQKSDEEVTLYFLKLSEEKINRNSKKYTFPIKNSYVSALKKQNTEEKIRELNHETLKAIGKQIKAIGVEKIEARIMAGAEANRQRGSNFKRWLTNGNHGLTAFDNFDRFEKAKEAAVLVGSDDFLRDISAEKFGYTASKGIDFVGKSKNDNYYVAEVKWLTDSGGTQDRQFENAIVTLEANFRPKDGYDLQAIAILDGIIWSDKLKNRKSPKTVRELQSNKIVLSALLIPELLNE